MTRWIFVEGIAWVLWDGSKVNADGTETIFDESSLYLRMLPVNGGIGLLAFGDLPSAEQYIRASGQSNWKPKEVKDFAGTLAFWKRKFPEITHIIPDPLAGHTHVRKVPIEDVIRGGRP